MLKSVLPHEMQNRPQNSLPLTPRLPIDGEPCRCKQEAADSVVTAGRTNGMVETANLPETIADVDRTAPLGGKPAERARGVDEGDGTEREPQSWLQQTIFYSKEDIQRNANVNENVPNAYGLPLKGEWEVCASGEARDPRSSTNAPNATPECVHRPSELSETKDAEGVESEGCEGGTDEPTELLTMSVEPYVEDGGDIPCVRLGGTRMRPGDANGPGCQADRLRGPTDVLRSWTDTLNVSNSAGTAGLGHSDDLGTYLSVTDAKRVILETDDDGCHTDASTRQTDVLSVETDLRIPANTPANVRIPRKREKPPDLPIGATRGHPDEPNGCGNHADGSSTRTDMHTIGNERETAANETGNVRRSRNDPKSQNSPIGPEITPPKSTHRWKRVGVGNVNVYLPWNVPIEALRRTLAFGEAESGEEAIAPIIEGERAGNGGGDRNGDDESGDGNGMASSCNVDSTQVGGVQLAGEAGQHKRPNTENKRNVPMSSRPPIRHPNHPYRNVMR